MIEIMLTFLVRLGLTEHSETKLLYPNCVSLLKQALSLWPDGRVKPQYFEKIMMQYQQQRQQQQQQIQQHAARTEQQQRQLAQQQQQLQQAQGGHHNAQQQQQLPQQQMLLLQRQQQTAQQPAMQAAVSEALSQLLAPIVEMLRCACVDFTERMVSRCLLVHIDGVSACFDGASTSSYVAL